MDMGPGDSPPERPPGRGRPTSPRPIQPQDEWPRISLRQVRSAYQSTTYLMTGHNTDYAYQPGIRLFGVGLRAKEGWGNPPRPGTGASPSLSLYTT